MALQLFFPRSWFEVLCRSSHRCANAPTPCSLFLLIFSATLIGAVCARAQTPQQQYVYASVPVTTTTSEVAGFSKDGGTGVLSGIGAPLADALEGGAMAVDAKGRFLFIVNPNSNGISMFQIDQATGTLSEVFGSPFAAGPTENPTTAPSSPNCLATERSGQFLYVGYGNGNFQGESAVLVYQIDPATPRLVPPSTPAGSSNLPSVPIGLVTDPRGVYLYVGLGPNLSLGTPASTTNVYSIGVQLSQAPVSTAGGENLHERTIAIDAQGRFFFNGGVLPRASSPARRFRLRMAARRRSTPRSV